MAKPQSIPGQDRPLTKTEKAALLLLCMDESATATVFQGLQDDEIRKIGTALLKLNQVPASQLQMVMNEFTKEMTDGKASIEQVATDEVIPVEGKKIISNFLGKTLNKDRSAFIMSSIQAPMLAASGQRLTLDKFVAQCDEKTLYALIANEHPQVIALTVSLARRPVARAVLEKFAPEVQIDILRRMGKLEKVPDQHASGLAQYLAERVAERAQRSGAGGAGGGAVEEESDAVPDLEIAGLAGTVKLLKSLGAEKADAAIAELEKADPALAARVRKLMFVMEDLERAEDAGIRELMRVISNDDLKIALKNAGDGLKQKFFKNMSERASLILREDMEVMAPLKVEEIEAAQERILTGAKNLMKEEKLKLAAAADEEGG